MLSGLSSFLNRLRSRQLGHLVKDRYTGRIAHEKISLDMWWRRGLFSEPFAKIDRMQWFRRWLRTENIHAGHKMNRPASAKKIPGFVKFYGINMNDFQDQEYNSFNDFFTREIREGARPISSPDDDHVIVSPADSRVVVYDSIQRAQKFWIKSKEFTLEKLLGESQSYHAQQFHGGEVASFRLSPQDYHHYHSPVAGTVVAYRMLQGSYYSVDPNTIQSDIDVLGENHREWLIIRSPTLGNVLFVAIGADDVGTVAFEPKIKVGYELAKGERIGKFSYGGSSVLVAFEPNKVRWDSDLVENTAANLETYIHMGDHVGRASND